MGNLHKIRKAFKKLSPEEQRAIRGAHVYAPPGKRVEIWWQKSYRHSHVRFIDTLKQEIERDGTL